MFSIAWSIILGVFNSNSNNQKFSIAKETNLHVTLFLLLLQQTLLVGTRELLRSFERHFQLGIAPVR